jgi:hypothetical protein
MASAIFFNGRRISTPGAYSKIDASALSSVSPAAVGVVALLGTAEGGKPLTSESTYADATRAEKIMERYRSGNLRTAGLFAFEPSADDAIPQGAQRIVAMKVNPATQSTVTLPDSLAANSAVLTSADWGLFTAQINVKVEAGTLSGKKITIVFEDESEVLDNVGGDAVFTVAYAPSSNGYGAITGVVSSTQFVAAATKALAGLTVDRTADIPVPGAVRVSSAAAGDTTQTVTVYGLTAGNVPIKETLALAGVAVVQGLTVFAKVLGVKKSAVTAGTVTVTDSVIPTTLFTLTAGTLTKGLSVLTAAPAAGVVTVSIDVNSAVSVVVRGYNAAGAEVAERFDMAAAVIPVVGTVVFASLMQVELGDVAGARTVTSSLNAVVTSHSTYKTVQKVVDYINTKSGCTAVAVVSNPTTFQMTDMDYLSAVTILSVTTPFYANLYKFIAAVNGGSQYVVATRATAATREPAITAGVVFLAGGSEGTTTITQWQQAFTELKKRRVNIIVPLTQDSAVHALLLSHLVQCAGKLRSEANGYVGLGTIVGAGETKANIKSQIQALNSRHVNAISQEVQRSDPDTGEATWYPPFIAAALAAGMQAGAPIGEPLTHKRPMVTDVRNDSSWSVIDDEEEMIDAGLQIMENIDGVGIRFVRSITTHLADDNVVFCESSANAACNEAIYRFRRQLELKVGKRGAVGSVTVLKGLANAELGNLINDGIIVAYRSLQIEQVGDVFPVSVEIAPVLPINFIPITVHLVAVRAAA